MNRFAVISVHLNSRCSQGSHRPCPTRSLQSASRRPISITSPGLGLLAHEAAHPHHGAGEDLVGVEPLEAHCEESRRCAWLAEAHARARGSIERNARWHLLGGRRIFLTSVALTARCLSFA